ncbi:choline transporter-like 1 [Parasteatoda tepidariorum]|uniref:choline transporter-like 1 n=1 Tax=Parasteatoda tepidariorum TaxID=114398 RepID=UPI00077FB81F|nr:choline transporter-like 1 [Parasteatoda tepidariorum]
MSPCCGQSENEPKMDKSKSCTDVFCLLIFGVFWGLLIFIAAFAFVIGNPMSLEYGQDSFGNTCGMKNEELGNMTFSGMDMTDRPYLFFLNMTNLYQSLKICVKQCPYRTLRDEAEARDFEIATGSRLCRYDITEYQGRSRLYPEPINETIANGHYACPEPPIFATKPIFKRCIPLPVANFASDIIYSIYAYLNSFDTIQKVVSDVYAVKFHILGMVALAIVLSVIVVLLIHKLASFVSWIIMIVACVACIAGTVVLWWTYIDLKWQLDSTSTDETLIESVKNEEAFLVYSIMTTIFTIILLLIVLVMRKRVSIVVKLFTEASECIKSMPLILLQPVFTFIALALFLTFWVAVLVAIATAYYPVRNTIQGPLQFSAPLAPLPSNYTHLSPEPQHNLVNRAFTLVSFTEGSWVQYMWWYHIIALVWTSEFILGCQQMAIAGAVATWYFSRDRSTVSSPVCKSVTSLCLYHMGSVALGAFLITVFKIPRLILTYMISLMRKHQEWKCVAWCLKCCTCCLWCMEKCIRYLNHNAYTIVAIQGVGFCSAAREAFDILMSNALQVATINSVGDFVLFLGKCSVTAITAFACIVIFKNDPDLYFYAVPVVLICVIAYFIAHCVLSVYEMVIDTLFLCVCEDILRNDGSKEKPYFGGSLVRFIKGTEGGHSLQPLNKVADNSETE